MSSRQSDEQKLVAPNEEATDGTPPKRFDSEAGDRSEKDDDEVEEGGDEGDEDGRDDNTSTPQRKKRARRVYNGMIECNVEPVRSLLTCTLCDGLFREPYTTLKCFHTFCKSCLITAIRASYNTPQYNCCPICQTYFGRDDIVTNNALPDRVLETLIDKVLFPNLSHQDQLLESEFYHKRNIRRRENATITMNESVVGKTKMENNNTTASNVEHKSTPINGTVDEKRPRPIPKTVILSDDRDQTISFQLVPYPVRETGQSQSQLRSLNFPFFQTSAQIRMEQVKKLLVLKLFPDTVQGTDATGIDPSHEKQNELELYCNGCLLEDELTLNFISHAIWGAGMTYHHITDNNGDDGPSDTAIINERTTPLTLEYKYVMRQEQVGTDTNKEGTHV
jgi:hypothetical protein